MHGHRKSARPLSDPHNRRSRVSTRAGAGARAAIRDARTGRLGTHIVLCNLLLCDSDGLP
eukprot:1192587-Prorocentrum_minimum.AAC.8